MIRTRMPYVASADLKRFDFFLLTSIHLYALPVRMKLYAQMCRYPYICVCVCVHVENIPSTVHCYNAYNVFYIHTIIWYLSNVHTDNAFTVNVDILFYTMYIYIYSLVHTVFFSWVGWVHPHRATTVNAASWGKGVVSCESLHGCF